MRSHEDSPPGALSACRKGFALLVWLVAAGCFPCPALAEFALLRPTRDSTLIESSSGAFANGSGPALFAGRISASSNYLRRALIAFDPAGSIPAGSRITAVTLMLNLSSTNVGPVEVTLHRVQAGWSEGPSSSAGGGGASSLPGDSTWIHRSYPDLRWSSQGGDFDATSSGAALVDQPGSYTWETTPEMVADLQAWLDAPEGNHGWLIKGDESRPTTSKRFDSRESPEESLRPLLYVRFVPPCNPDPRGPGYWRRLCQAPSDLGRILSERGSQKAPVESGFSDTVLPCADWFLGELGLPETGACEALLSDTPLACTERAVAKLSVLVLNVCSGRLQTSCPLDAAEEVCGVSSIGELLLEMSRLLAEGDCRKASGCAGIPD